MKSVVPLRALIVAHLFYVVAPAGEADYTLDDSFWNEESPVGEVERLLKEYRQNQEMVRKIGSHYYQIIYPVQLRHHEKMGISTREVGTVKYPPRDRDRQYGNNGGGQRGRTRTGKHFHRTSLLIKAFNHKFRLDLELNTQLLAPNIQQKHILSSGYSQEVHQEIEHCYYHGTVKDYPGASAAFHTCNGVSGVIHVGNETFVIHPFYGGDLSKHPHIIFEARPKANKGCANSGNLEWRMTRRQKPMSGLVDIEHPNGAGRYKRDVREATKYIETALIIDNAMFQKRNGSTRAEVVHDAIQVANIADLYFRTLNTRVSVVYIESWQGMNQVQIDGNKDISKALSNFNDYTNRNLFKIDKDTTQLLTGETFTGGEAGMAVPETVCTQKAVGISVDVNVYEAHLLAGTMAHMIGHNIGMGHDDGRQECFCRDWHGCIMAQAIVGLEKVQPYKFSECSLTDYVDALRIGHGICLLNKPNELEVRRNCGNGLVEEGEDCDCGAIGECNEESCCDPITCKLKKEAQCASGTCCEKCLLRPQGSICRDTTNECDLAEFCTGESGECPTDIHKKNGVKCGTLNGPGYCFNGNCPTLNSQCEQVWGYGGTAADIKCYEQFNSKGSINGHCGISKDKNFIKCQEENIQCGSLQCKEGDRQPVYDNSPQNYSRTIISIQGVEYECKATSVTNSTILPPNGLVLDGTPCGNNLICVNQTCVSIFNYIDQSQRCPSNQQNSECSDNGVCTNTNRCFCDYGWGGPDCSITIAITTTVPTTTTTTTMRTTPSNDMSMKRIEIKYGDQNVEKISTLQMVIILVVIVKGVFLCFALMAVCYRRKTTRLKYDPPYVKKPIAKGYSGGATANHHSVEEVSLDGSNKLISYGNQGGFRDHKMQQIRRLTGSGSEEDPTHSGEEETVSFIDLPPNNMSKLPEKGILKKHGFGLVIGENCKDKWGDDSQSDNLELIAQQETSVSQTATGLTTTTGEVERTLKSLNGYHEDILEALRNAASHRGTGAGNTPSGSGSLTEDMLRKQLESAALGYSEPISYKRSSSKSGSKENICDTSQPHTVLVEGQNNTMMHHHRPQQPNHDEDDIPSAGPLRIRNLEDLIRQLEHHSSRHMSPSGSEDIRMSETEADRHYRLDSSAACSESSQGSNQQLAQSQKTATIHPSYSSRCRPRSDDESRFVYGRYRHPPSSTTGRHPQHPSHSPHAFSHHTHHGHAHGHPSHGPHSSHHSSHTHLHQDEDGIYESADHRDRPLDVRDTPDSESDDFIQAQQPLARWASEDVVSVVVMDPGTGQVHGPSSTAGSIIHGDTSSMGGSLHPVGGPTQLHQPRDYYPSPPSTETESSGSVIQPPQPQQRRSIIDVQGDGQQQMDNSGRYPEYKH